MVFAAAKELKDTKALIKAINRQAWQATTVEEQHQLQGKVRDAEKSIGGYGNRSLMLRMTSLLNGIS